MATPERKRRVAIGFLGSTRDSWHFRDRWNRWRPSVGLFMQEDLLFDRFEMLSEPKFEKLAGIVTRDIQKVSPETEVRRHVVQLGDPWDFASVYAELHAFAQDYPFDPDNEDYLIHISTGTHVCQICLFLLTETRHFPARLVQTSPAPGQGRDVAGTARIIDLDLSKYDLLATRFEDERLAGVSLLKSGIATRNADFNRQIDLIEKVALVSTEPILLMGPTGAGKSQLASRIWELKKQRHQLEGPFVEVNCATLRGDSASSALFGHVKGAFTGAVSARAGLLRTANEGLLFLDEIGELGLDEQAMLLRALEEKRFLPVGGDREVESDFQLVGGTNRDLRADVAAGRFREDLLARIDLWAFELPSLRDRIEDVEPNLDYELDRFAQKAGRRATFTKEARDAYLRFATGPEASWAGNFRDLNASVTRLATLADSGRVSVDLVRDEIDRLKRSWRREVTGDAGDDVLAELVPLESLDLFDRVQLAEVVRVCRRSRTLSEAGRSLFAASRARKTSSNDADRLRKYLARFGLTFDDVK